MIQMFGNLHLQRYIVGQAKMIPESVYIGMLSVFCIGLVICLLWKGFRKGLRYSALLFMLEYIMLIICSTVIFRKTGMVIEQNIVFNLFWSYVAIANGKQILIKEVLMNVAVFIPIGFLLVLSFHNMSLRKAIVIGVCISLGIELLQFFYGKGFSEIDDVIHNTLGCMIGYGIACVFRIIIRKKKPFMNVVFITSA